jgi:hypothetical protein
MILFLDDSHERAALAYQRMTPEDANDTMWVETAIDCISNLWQYRAELHLVSLDHDLGGTHWQDSRAENCGMEVVRWLEKQDHEIWKDCRFVVHSWNPGAARRMVERLEAKGYRVTYKPFGT